MPFSFWSRGVYVQQYTLILFELHISLAKINKFVYVQLPKFDTEHEAIAEQDYLLSSHDEIV